MQVELGDFSSWTVISEDIIVIHTDDSIFKGRGTAVDVRVRSFWGVESLKYPLQEVVLSTL